MKKTWNDRLNEALKETGKSQADLVRGTGVSAATVSQWCAGIIKSIKATNADAICAVLGINAGWLLNGKGAMMGKNPTKGLDSTNPVGDVQGEYQDLSPLTIKGWVPLISYVQAGSWSEAIDLYEPGYAERVSPTVIPHSKSTFALRVEGRSMTLPEGVSGLSFPHGMVVYVDPEMPCPDGSYVVARYDGNKATFKRLIHEEGRPILVPLNPDRSEYPVIRDEFEIIGRVFDASWGGVGF